MARDSIVYVDEPMMGSEWDTDDDDLRAFARVLSAVTGRVVVVGPPPYNPNGDWTDDVSEDDWNVALALYASLGNGAEHIGRDRTMARFRIENDNCGLYPWHVVSNADGETQALEHTGDHGWLRDASDNPGWPCAWATREELVAAVTAGHFMIDGDAIL